MTGKVERCKRRRSPLGDAIAAGAALVMGEASEGTPVVIARGLEWTATERNGAALLRPQERDLFR
jgi:coenzyme F420-0:L-glutamate ligase/coenzyme F420-1:gamma-L-glutamate ligase